MTQVLRTQVCVAGGGPAGMIHALLLARAGIEVAVLEKHNDFLRDFRGDTVHPAHCGSWTSWGSSTSSCVYRTRSHANCLRHRRHTSHFRELQRTQTARFQAAVHRTDAAVGLPGLSRRKSQCLPGIHLDPQRRGQGFDLRGRSSRRGAHAGTGGACRAGGRRRRTRIGGAGCGRSSDRRGALSDGRLVVPAEVAPGRPSRAVRNPP